VLFFFLVFSALLSHEIPNSSFQYMLEISVVLVQSRECVIIRGSLQHRLKKESSHTAHLGELLNDWPST